MADDGVRLTITHQRVFYAVFLTLLATGLLWLVFHYFEARQGEFGPEPHPLESWWLKLHGGAAMVALLALGSIIRGHIIGGWRGRRNRSSGALLVAVAIVLIATGWALYYVGAPAVRPYISAAHWVLGTAAAVVLLAHVRYGWTGRARRGATSRTPASNHPKA
jgi:hypothetical protein